MHTTSYATYHITGQALPRTLGTFPPGMLQVRVDGVDRLATPFAVSQPTWTEHPVVAFTATRDTHTVAWVNVHPTAFSAVIVTGLAVRRVP